MGSLCSDSASSSTGNKTPHTLRRTWSEPEHAQQHINTAQQAEPMILKEAVTHGSLDSAKVFMLMLQGFNQQPHLCHAPAGPYDVRLI